MYIQSMRCLFLLILILQIPSLAYAAEALSGDRIKLDDGRILRLQGIKGVGDAAKIHLQELLAEQSPVIEGGVLDRYGEVAADVHVGQKWLQGEMLQAGLAFIYPPTGNEPHLGDMLKLEQEARVAKRGIWQSDKDLIDLPANDPQMGYGHFAFVSGKVVKAERVKNMFYLNFGNDWHKDFTVAIAAHDLVKWRRADIDLEDYEGKNVRVRGWIKRNFGPMIMVTHPAQIETLSAAP